MHFWYVGEFRELLAPRISILQLWHIVITDETLRNVIQSVTRSWMSIVMTAILAVIILYHFAIVGYVHFGDDFKLDVRGPDVERNDDGWVQSCFVLCAEICFIGEHVLNGLFG
jgi:hypothetical protein